jgi:hypothetical protein
MSRKLFAEYYTYIQVHLVSGIPHTHSVNAYKNMASFLLRGNLCGALLRWGGYSSVYPTMTLSMKCLKRIPLFESIRLELREEFVNRQIHLRVY